VKTQLCDPGWKLTAAGSWGAGAPPDVPAALEGWLAAWDRGLFRPDLFDQPDGLSAAPCHLRLAFLTAAAHSAEESLGILERYSSLSAIEAALEQARGLAEIEMNELEISNAQLKDFQTLLSLLVFPSHALRSAPSGWLAIRKVSQACGLLQFPGITPSSWSKLSPSRSLPWPGSCSRRILTGAGAPHDRSGVPGPAGHQL
jgi:hypothetical protein